MHRVHSGIMGVLVLTLALVASACTSSTPAASPTATAVKSSSSSTGTTPVSQMQSGPTQGAVATATTVSTPTAASSSGSGTSITNLTTRAKGNTEYSYDSIITTSGQSLTSKAFVKGMKMRTEVNIAGQKSVMLIDGEKKLAYTLLGDGKTAMKMDFSQVGDNANPGAQIGGLPADAKSVGTETIDGKSAAVYEYTNTYGTTKIWIWIEKGLPLKSEVNSKESKSVVEFTNYQFSSLADSLFELPPGTTVTELPGLGNIPAPGR